LLSLKADQRRFQWWRVGSIRFQEMVCSAGREPISTEPIDLTQVKPTLDSGNIRERVGGDSDQGSVQLFQLVGVFSSEGLDLSVG